MHKLSPPLRKKNKELRPREHLSPSEIDLLIASAKKIGRHGHRDATMILIAYRHGLRASELINLKWSQFDLKNGIVHVNRIKNGINTTHPLSGKELRALKKIQKNYPDTQFVFVTERKTPMTDSNFRKMVSRAAQKGSLPITVHPHMLRHSTGFKLANDGQDTRAIQHYLGHKNIQHTVIYTNMSPNRFKDFWND